MDPSDEMPMPAGRSELINMLRTTQQHHVTLSSMADQKANILIGVNSVVFALVVRSPATMSLPMLVLAAASLLGALLCMLAVVPTVGRTPPSLRAVEPNMLFFGAFADHGEPAFQAYMAGLAADEEAMRRAMVRDIYQIGLVLRNKKYRFLTLGYRVFMVGLAASFVAFGVQYLVR